MDILNQGKKSVMIIWPWKRKDLEDQLREAAEGGFLGTAIDLLEAGIAVDALSESGKTALMKAAEAGHEDMVVLLLIKGANVNLKGGLSKKTALMRAAKRGHYEIMKILLEHGADPTLESIRHRTAEDYAIHEGRKEIVSLIRFYTTRKRPSNPEVSQPEPS
jgi:ankyrin repeat protein